MLTWAGDDFARTRIGHDLDMQGPSRGMRRDIVDAAHAATSVGSFAVVRNVTTPAIRAASIGPT